MVFSDIGLLYFKRIQKESFPFTVDKLNAERIAPCGIMGENIRPAADIIKM